MHQTNIPDLSAKELLTIMAVAEYGSFIAASAFLKTSQPALSRAVKRVERILGVTLFARSTRHVEITSAGREFIAVAERILNDLQLTLRNMREVANEQRGQVIVSTFPAFAYQPMPDIVRLYRETRQQVQIRVREGNYLEILEDVCSGVADFGITYEDTLPDTVQGVHLRREPLYVVFPADHPFAAKNKTRIGLAELRNHPMVSIPSDAYTRRMVDGAAAAAGFILQHAVTVPRFQNIINYVRVGVGVGVVPAGALPERPWQGFDARLLVSPSLSVPIGLITLRARYMTPAASSLFAQIKEYVAPGTEKRALRATK